MASLVFVSLFRLWAAARAGGDNPLPALHDRLALFAPGPELAAACASLFELVEAQLGRELVPECCCSRAFSRDERALLGLLRHAPGAGQTLTGASIPHGLPGALRWAAFAVRRGLRRSLGGAPEADGEAPPGQCPFRSGPGFSRNDGTNRRTGRNLPRVRAL